MACEDSNSKLVKVVTVAYVDAEKRVDNSMVELNPWVCCVFGNILSYNHCGHFLISYNAPDNLQ